MNLKKEKKLLISMDIEEAEKLKWLAFQSNMSKSEVIRRMIEADSATLDKPGNLNALIASKTAELNQLEAKVKELEARNQVQIQTEPIKEARQKQVYAEAINAIIQSIGREKENMVADGQATYLRSFGMKVSKIELLNEAYRKAGLPHKIKEEEPKL